MLFAPLRIPSSCCGPVSGSFSAPVPALCRALALALTMALTMPLASLPVWAQDRAQRQAQSAVSSQSQGQSQAQARSEEQIFPWTCRSLPKKPADGPLMTFRPVVPHRELQGEWISSLEPRRLLDIREEHFSLQGTGRNLKGTIQEEGPQLTLTLEDGTQCRVHWQLLGDGRLALNSGQDLLHRRGEPALPTTTVRTFGNEQCRFTVTLPGVLPMEEAEDGVRQALIGLYGEGPLFGFDADEAEGSLEERLSHQVKWMEVEREGSRMIIRFTSAKHAQSETLRDDDLIAQRDGIIAGFDVQHGEKRVALNQSVKKGDVLVSSLMADSRGNAEHLHVKGRVFAYTWEEVELEAERSAMPQPLQFFSMLLQARAQVSSSFLKDDRIVSENILQFGEKAGKIKLVIHYTLYRDISSPA